jgi:hypothetical protein
MTLAGLIVGVVLTASSPMDNAIAPLSVVPAPFPLPVVLHRLAIPDALSRCEGVPGVRVAKPFSVVLAWTARSAFVGECKPFVRIMGSGPAREWEFDWPAGTTVAGADFSTSTAITVPRFTHVGDGRIAVGLRHEEREAIVGMWPVHVAPIIITSTCEEDALRTAFGEHMVNTKASFRLGVGSRIAVPLPKTLPGPVTGIGLVSCLAYGNVAQDELVGTVEPRGCAVDDAARLRILAGVHTALEDYDKLRPGTHLARKIDVFESSPSKGAINWERKPYERHHYQATLHFDAPCMPGKLEIAYTRDEGVWDVQALVLLIGEEN